MTVISGDKLAINGASFVIDWSVDHTQEPIPFIASNTNRGVLQACGVKDWKGEYNMVGIQPGLNPGEIAAFAGSADGAVGVSGNVIGKAIEIVAHPLSNAPIMSKVEFEGDGEPTWGAQVLADSSSPIPVCSVYGTVSALSGLDIAFWRLRLEALNVAYASPETAGYRKRSRGGFTGTFQARVFTNSGAGLPQVGTILSAVEFGVGESDLWTISHFKPVLLRAIIDANKQGDTREPSGYDLVWKWTSQNASGSDGVVTAPDASTVWPYEEDGY